MNISNRKCLICRHYLVFMCTCSRVSPPFTFPPSADRSRFLHTARAEKKRRKLPNLYANIGRPFSVPFISPFSPGKLYIYFMTPPSTISWSAPLKYTSLRCFIYVLVGPNETDTVTTIIIDFYLLHETGMKA